MEGSNSEFGAGEKLRHRQARSGGASSQKRGSFFGLYSGKQDVKGRESSRRGRGSSPDRKQVLLLGSATLNGMNLLCLVLVEGDRASWNKASLGCIVLTKIEGGALVVELFHLPRREREWLHSIPVPYARQ